MKVILAGAGKSAEEIKGLLQDHIEILYWLDNDFSKINSDLNGIKIYSPYQCPKIKYDYVIITLFNADLMEQQLLICGFEREKIIKFFSDSIQLDSFSHIFRKQDSKIYRLEKKVDYISQRIIKEEDDNIFCQHFVYELVDELKQQELRLPRICSVEETCAKIIHDRVSMSRYGDGEFEIILGKAKDVYQDNDELLAKRLKEILQSNVENHIIALADDYGSLDGLRVQNKNSIRRYMDKEKRKKHYELIDLDKQYYNAYISRPYAIYNDFERKFTSSKFNQLKQIWKKQKILVIEGEKTRTGVGNDLFSEAESVERIIAPSENAFDVYNAIFQVVLQQEKDRLVLIALGPTATVLAYDLAKEGYWALDIGHLDLEYEWFLKGESYSYIPEKYNNELPGDTFVIPVNDKEYEKSIIGIIES